MPTDAAQTITLAVGQVVYWPASPTGFAQIDDLRRSNVGLVYPVGRRGTVRRPLVPVGRLAALVTDCPLLFDLHNPFGRGCLRRTKTYRIPPPPKQQVPADSAVERRQPSLESDPCPSQQP